MKRMTAKQTWLAAVLTPVAFVAGILIVLVPFKTGLVEFPAEQQPSPTVSHEPSLDAQLVEQHGCWSGMAPPDMEGKTPGHVVVTKNGRTWYAGPRMVQQALGQQFADQYHGLTIHGFCR